jgi:hypothetical protein
MLDATGIFVVSPGEARINVDTDFCNYYRKFIISYYGEDPYEFQTPKHGAHITIISSKIHPNTNTESILKFNGDIIPFKYDYHIHKGGTRFTTYYAYVECFFAEFIKRKLGVMDGSDYLGLHICICNNKSRVKNSN